MRLAVTGLHGQVVSAMIERTRDSLKPLDEFDGVLAFGGPLSYAFDHVDEALAGAFTLNRVSNIHDMATT